MNHRKALPSTNRLTDRVYIDERDSARKIRVPFLRLLSLFDCARHFPPSFASLFQPLFLPRVSSLTFPRFFLSSGFLRIYLICSLVEYSSRGSAQTPSRQCVFDSVCVCVYVCMRVCAPCRCNRQSFAEEPQIYLIVQSFSQFLTTIHNSVEILWYGPKHEQNKRRIYIRKNKK